MRFPRQLFFRSTFIDFFESISICLLLPSRHLLVQSQQWIYYINVLNLFKVSDKDTRLAIEAAGIFFLNLEQYFLRTFLMFPLNKQIQSG